MYNSSYDPTHRASSDHEEELYDLLKEGEDPNPDTSVESNENDSTVGTTKMYPEPVTREGKELDAPWGEPGVTHDGRQEPFHNSDGVWGAHQDTRFQVLRNQFSGYDQAAKADQGLINQNFDNSEFETHSALLERKSKPEQKHTHTKAAEARRPTLLERVKAVAGRP